ncbi:MAG: DUF1735 domain-containing protein [Bacteroidales bacterium]|nr:DUF1735 domain-containing protein [Bacteroidales bacterium]
MKKTIIWLAAVLLLTGCIRDERDNFMVPDSFGINADDLLQETSVHTGNYVLGISKSGKGQASGKVSISLAETALPDYNQAHETDFKAVLPSLVSFDQEMLDFAVEDVTRTFTISWDPELMAQFIAEDTRYVIPLRIQSQDLTVNEGRELVLLHLNRSGISVPQANVSRVVEAKDVEPGPGGEQPELQETLILDVNLKPAVKYLGLSFPVCIDNSLIDSYNQAHQTSYVPAPDGLVTLLDNDAVIEEGAMGGNFRVLLDKSVLLKDGQLGEFPDYLIPVRLQREKLTASLHGEDFDLKGLSYGNLVTYISFSYYAPPPGLSVIRMWGKYSTETASWSDYLGDFTAGADRNVALDDNYIYIAETNTSKNLWAISLQDPGIYKRLPVGTVADEGIFYLSCPRIIPNTSADINGGKDVLAVSNMNAGDPKLYVYADGIDADPKVINMSTWASRRLGDTFTFWGSMQGGMLFFKDFSSPDGTVTFKLNGLNAMWLMGRIVAPAAVGAGAYFPFPDNINQGVSSVRGGETAWLTTASKDLYTLEGADKEPTLAELSGYFADTAFRFFEFDGKRYIAYTRQVSPSDGRLFILEGEAGQSWSGMLEERNVIYQAAIQNDTEQEGLDDTPSPKASGNSGMDLDVRIAGNEVYIAVVKQNVGLSLFRMSVN